MSSLNMPQLELPGLRVTLDRLVYHPVPPNESIDKPHGFTYFISIHNDSEVSITIHGRKWVVTEESGSILVVQGDGVVGKFPKIDPGDKFSYHSWHKIGSLSATVEGAYLGLDASQRWVVVRIPRFQLKVPNQHPEL